MNNYRHIYFDLDHTLWDFEKNCAETLNELYTHFNLSRFGIDVNDFINAYQRVNYQMWEEYNRGQLKKSQIRSERFGNIFELMGLKRKEVPADLNEEFLRICPAKGNVIPYAHEILSYLAEKGYSLHIITNGFKETQHIKISSSNLDRYFRTIINSEICGFSKPDKKIFDYARKLSKADCRECIMVGDDLFTDIGGARNAGIDSIFFNPRKLKHEEKVTFEISCLSELKKIF
jgi:putative hydrolase of the HAD superfamily